MKNPEFKKGTELYRGKTKIIFQVKGDHNLVILENMDKITKNDDPDQTKVMTSKAECATATTSMVFQLLKDAGLPVAYEGQLSKTEFLAKKCCMIPLEVIIRRYAVGSYLKRYPNLEKPEGEPPLRFHRLVFELFLKTTNGEIRSMAGDVIDQMSVDVLAEGKEKVVDDPLIANPYEGEWRLKHPKISGWDKNSDLGKKVERIKILPEVSVEQIEEITRKVFLVLEGAWSQLGCRLIDFKIEFGIGPGGELLIADVIDNDSWRLRTADWKELSKQLFRDNYSMEEISEKYMLVSKLVERFSIPKQALVLWRGSEKDNQPEIPEVPGVKNVGIIRSGHKSPQACLNLLEEILAEYPEGGVIIPIVGMSNGLGPILSARTSWPVIAVPASVDKNPQDVWSSLSMPRNVPMMTVLSGKNAILAALNILAQKNPAAYMFRQYALEELDV